MKNPVKNEILSAFKMTSPVMAGYVFLGVTFGLLAVTAGLGRWVPVLMSAVIYSGALEFAAVPLLTAAFDPISALLLGVTISLRHLFYGIPMLKKYENTGKMKPFLIFGLTDETFSLLSSQDAPAQSNPKRFYFFVTLFDYLYWNLGTVIGAVLGNVTAVNLDGLDFVLTALFVVLFLEQIKTKTGLKSGVVGLVCSALALLLFGSSSFVMAAMGLVTVALLAGRSVIAHE